MKSKLILSLAFAVMLCSWTKYGTTPIDKAKWLTGTWANTTKKGIVYETWTQRSSEELFGKSYLLKGSDTVIFETVRLVQEKDKLVYIPTVEAQNNRQPVRFVSVLVSEDKLVFENKTHDFPQLISYSRLGNDSLMAEISGTKNGKEGKQSFPMKRIK